MSNCNRSYETRDSSTNMYSIWTPSTCPPNPKQISGLSKDAEVVWKVLKQNHQQKMGNIYNRNPQIDAGNYYKSLHKKTFSVPQQFNLQQKVKSNGLHMMNMELSNIGASQDSVTSRFTVMPLSNQVHAVTTVQKLSSEHQAPRTTNDHELCHKRHFLSSPDFISSLHHSFATEQCRYNVKPSSFSSCNTTLSDTTKAANQISITKSCQPDQQHIPVILSSQDIQLFDPTQSTQQSQNSRETEEQSQISGSPPLDLSGESNESFNLYFSKNTSKSLALMEQNMREEEDEKTNDVMATETLHKLSEMPTSSITCRSQDLQRKTKQFDTMERKAVSKGGSYKSLNLEHNCYSETITENKALDRDTSPECQLSELQQRTKQSGTLKRKTISSEEHLKSASHKSHSDLNRNSEPIHKNDSMYEHVDEETAKKSIKSASASITRRLQELQRETQQFGTSKRKAVFLGHSKDILSQRNVDCQMEVSVAKQCTRTSFSAPFKKLKQSKLKMKPTAKSQMKKCSNLSTAEQKDLEHELSQAKEVALTVVYSDGSSQLSAHLTSQKKKNSTEGQRASHVAVAYTVNAEQKDLSQHTSLETITFSLDEQAPDIAAWNRNVLGSLMSSNTRKLCYEAQQLIIILIKSFEYDHSVVCCKWQVMDPSVATWLLDPDQQPTSFADVLKPFNDLNQVVDDSRGDQVYHDLSLLGPVMLRLYNRLKIAKLWDLFTKLEMPLCPLLALMEVRGLKVDTKVLTMYADLLKRKINELENSAHKAVGHSFLLNSHVQLRQILFEDLKLDEKLDSRKKIARTSANNQKSTSEAVLTLLEGTHPLPSIVLQHRQLQKLKSTYIDGMLSCVVNGWLHTHWDHTSAATGRLTSVNPNIQAIPKQHVTCNIANHGSQAVDIYARGAFVTKEGWSFLAADFQQIELRLLAHLSGDPSLLAVFTDAESQDIFLELTAQWLNKEKILITSAEREQTKRVVYSIMYGVGKEKLGEYLKISTEDAKCIMMSFLVRFPGVNSFTKSCIEKARSQGYQTTVLKRRRLFPHIQHPNPMTRAYAERQAVNFCVQGSAADLCKAAMLQVEHKLRKHELQAILLVQIHDELLLEVPDQELLRVAGLVKSTMEDKDSLCGASVDLKVPLKVSLSTGKSWGHLTDYKSRN